MGKRIIKTVRSRVENGMKWQHQRNCRGRVGKESAE